MSDHRYQLHHKTMMAINYLSDVMLTDYPELRIALLERAAWAVHDWTETEVKEHAEQHLPNSQVTT